MPDEIEHDPFAGPAVERVDAATALQSLARDWALQVPGAPASAQIRITVDGAVDATRLAEHLTRCLERVPALRTVAAPGVDCAMVLSGDLLSVDPAGDGTPGWAPALDARNGPIAALRVSAAAGNRAVVELALHPSVAGDAVLAPLWRAMTQDDEAALVDAECSPTDDAGAQRPAEGAVSAGDGSAGDAAADRAVASGRLRLAPGTLGRLGEVGESCGAPVADVVRAAWAAYLCWINRYEATDVLSAVGPDRGLVVPNLLAVQSWTAASDDTILSVLVRRSDAPSCDLAASVSSTGDLMSIQPVPVMIDGGDRISVSDAEVLSLPYGSALHINIVGTPAGEFAQVTHASNALGSQAALRHLRSFASLLDQFAERPETALADYAFVDDDRRREILAMAAGRELPVPSLPDITHRIFDEKRIPGSAEAVSVDGNCLTFGDLNAAVLGCRHWLAGQGMKKGACIGVMLDQSEAFIVTVLALLRSGMTYVPLDRKHPLDRLEYICADAGIDAIVTSDAFQVPGENLPRQLLYSGARSDRALKPVAGDAPAYILYTSGSTGRPKGVRVSRRAMLAHAAAIVEDFGLRPGDRVLQFASTVFDVAVEEIFPTLAAGATVVLLPDKSRLGISEFHRFLDEQRLTVANLPANYWHEWVRHAASTRTGMPESLRLVIAGSDRVSPGVFETWVGLAGSRIAFRNGYGPTETTVTATLYDPSAGMPNTATVPIGRPIANMAALVVRGDKLVPIGIAGELLLGGPQVADGYVGRDDLNAAAFVQANLDGTDRRWYRTGDLARYLADGNLEFLGRVDHQVKIEGFRIELGEVERALESLDGVTSTAVVVDKSVGGRSRLVAYYTTDGEAGPEAHAVLQSAAGSLPAYMVPAKAMRLPAMPLTAGGKIDRKALPAVQNKRPELVNPVVSPKGTVEASLAEIWNAELALDVIGVLDNFFDIGGSSMIGLRIIEAINRTLNTRVSAAQFFQYPTIRSFAGFLESSKGQDKAAAKDGPSRAARQRRAFRRIARQREGLRP